MFARGVLSDLFFPFLRGYQRLTRTLKRSIKKVRRILCYTVGKSAFSYIQFDLYSFLKEKELTVALTEDQKACCSKFYLCSYHHFCPTRSPLHTRIGRVQGGYDKYRRHRCQEVSTHQYLIKEQERKNMRFPYLLYTQTENCKNFQQHDLEVNSFCTPCKTRKSNMEDLCWSLRKLVHNDFLGKRLLLISLEAMPETILAYQWANLTISSIKHSRRHDLIK